MANDFDYFTFRISHLVSTSNECAKNIVMFSVSSFICFRFFFCLISILFSSTLDLKSVSYGQMLFDYLLYTLLIYSKDF